MVDVDVEVLAEKLWDAIDDNDAIIGGRLYRDDCTRVVQFIMNEQNKE